MTETGRAEEIRREEGLREELAGRKSAETYGVNYLIEAGAGAGKTYILTNRIINQLLTGKARPEELAAITFTEKATQQMVDEIDKRLLKQLDEAAAAHGEESAEAGRKTMRKGLYIKCPSEQSPELEQVKKLLA